MCNKVINVYYGYSESRTNTKKLSNLAERRFIYRGNEFGSVEHAYQVLKSGCFDNRTNIKYLKINGYGKKIRGKKVNRDFDNLQLMEDLIIESFRQNPDDTKFLKSFDDFTHPTNELIDEWFLNGLRKAKQIL